MSGISRSSTGSADGSTRWAALDKQNERLVDASHPLLAEFGRERAVHEQELSAAS